MLDAFFTWLRRRTAEAIVAGADDAMRALNGAADRHPHEVPANVTLLLDGPPKRERGGRSS